MSHPKHPGVNWVGSTSASKMSRASANLPGTNFILTLAWIITVLLLRTE
jgi:hypothetical protein